MCTNKHQTVLSNEYLTVKVNAHGAELCSIRYCGAEYLWQADPAFWKRHSPVLFPIVGSLWEGRCTVGGRTYAMSQHGFARDMEFEQVFRSDCEVRYRLTADEDTMGKYPYDFRLEIGYKIEERTIRVSWEVTNPSDTTLDFQIGAHPAFYYRNPDNSPTKGYFAFDADGVLHLTPIGEKGCADTSRKLPLTLDEGGFLPIVGDTFDNDALIFEEGQIHRVTLCDAERNPYLRMDFTAPLVGLWAPNADSPFVCIEPWYGRCDRIGYRGEFKDRDRMQHLQPRATFNGGYTIELL